MKLFKRITAGVTALGLCAGMAISGYVPAAAEDDNNDDWLHAVGSRLYDKDGNAIVNIPEYSQYSIYSLVCYMSEHTDEKIADDRTDTFLNVSFAPSEKKSIILGYCISDHFIYGDLVLQLHNSEPIFYQSDYVYLPLK